MAQLWRLMGHYDSVTTSYTACAGALQTSPYAPDFSARLIGLRTIVGGGAATSLVQHIQWRLNSVTFKPNVIEVGGQGSGLQTAPAVKIGEIMDWQVDQVVASGSNVIVEARNEAGAATPVTVEAMLYGLFEL